MKLHYVVVGSITWQKDHKISFSSRRKTGLKCFFSLFLSFILLSLFSSLVSADEYCYQETANISTACGALSTGSYTCVGNWGQGGYICEYAFDGNWSTFGLAEGNHVDYLLVNLSKNSSFIFGALFQIKKDVSTNLSIPDDCYDESPIQLKINSDARIVPSDNGVYCYNGTGWLSFGNSDSSYSSFYDGGIFWYLSDFIPPSIVAPANSTFEYLAAFLGVQFNTFDYIGVDTFFIDDTTNFTINSSGFLINVTNLVVGYYTINVSVNDTSGNLNSTLYGVTVYGTIVPSLVAPANSILEYSVDSLVAQFNATDLSGIDTFFIDDTTNFTINSSGFLINATNLAIGFYYLNVSVNDTLGNINSTIYQIEVFYTAVSGGGSGRTIEDDEIDPESVCSDYLDILAHDFNRFLYRANTINIKSFYRSFIDYFSCLIKNIRPVSGIVTSDITDLLSIRTP